jgi:conjugative relaxase-like TrwC/TraI family protein
MLRIRTVTTASDAKNYYAEADYYAQGQETVGQWGGKLAERLGLCGAVTKDAFDKLCDNINPATGKSLTQRTNDNRRVGYDMTYAGPKSFSILVTLGPEDVSRQCKDIFDEARDATQAEIEADMQTRVRIGGAQHDRPTGNMLTASFGHSTSRPVDGGVPDMHWHTHVFCFNATEDPVEGRIKAGEFSHILRDKAYYEAAFFARLAKSLADAGYAIDRRADGKWEVAGVPQALIDKFSKRTEEIEAAAKRLGITDPDRKGELGAKTRSKKNKELTPEQLRAAWLAQLTDGERDALVKVFGRDVAAGKEVTAREAVSFAIAHLSEQLSVFPEREVMRVAMLHGLGDVTPEEVARELPRQGVLVDVIDGQRMATTAALQAEENVIIGVAAGGRGSVCPVGQPDGLSRRMEDGKTLNDGQWDIVTGLLESSNRVNLVEGPAGAGKSSMLGKYDEALRKQGQTVTYLASSTDAVGVLEKDGFKVKTVAHFLLDEKMQKAAAGSRVVVDETSLLGHKDAVKLLRLTEKNNMKLIFVGDPMQHGSVPRGAFMRVLKDYGYIKPFRLTEILRQETPEYRAAAKLLSEGKSLEGFNALDALGWVKESADHDARVAAIASDYMQALKDGASCLVVSPTHAEAADITAAIRGQLRAAGKLATAEQEFTRLVNTNASEAQRGQALTYRSGDVIQFHQNAKGFRKGDRLTVSDPASVPLALADKFTLYRPEKIALAVSDKIRFTATVTAKDGSKLRNGENHSVAAITSGGNIRLENGKIIAGDAGHFRHGFVETSFGSQGKTVKRVILGMSSRSLPATNMEQLYVSASRAKARVTLYTDDKEAVKAAIGRSSQKLAALDIRPKAPADTTAQRQRMRELQDRRRRIAYTAQMRAAWEHTPARQQERDTGYGRSR